VRSVRLNNYNNWWFMNNDGWDRDRMLSIVAMRDNVCFTECWDGISAASIRAINPKARIYRVYDLCVKNSWDTDWSNPDDDSRMQTPLTKAQISAGDWWLRDRNGEIVKENEGSWFLDVGKPGFKEAYLRNLLSRISGSKFDGVVFDYWWPYMISAWLTRFGKPVSSQYPTDHDWYQKAWQPFIKYVASGVRAAGYRVIGNNAGFYMDPDPVTLFDRSMIDGVVYESWALGWGGEYISGNKAQQRLRSLHTDPLEVWVADFGLTPKLTGTAFDQKRALSLAMYYIAIPIDQSKRSFHYAGSSRVFWDSLWDLNIGRPLGTAKKDPAMLFWSREFTEGLVLLNYEVSRSVTRQLTGAFHTSDGKQVAGQITVPPHSAVLLQRDSSRS
jgi:hypothetical protein